MNSLHDVGGIDGFGPVVWEKNEPVFHEPWEAHMRAVDALMTKKLRAYCVDETRHRIERINPVYYLSLIMILIVVTTITTTIRGQRHSTKCGPWRSSPC
jgi:Nitrile hydratase beta subunit